MPKRRGSSPPARLPGFDLPAQARDSTPVTLPMREVHSGTPKAWFLAPLGLSSGKAAFAARALVTRGEGPLASQFTMPRWIARENRWLR